MSSPPRTSVNEPDAPEAARLREKTYRFVIVAVTLAFAWILLPFYGVVFWAVVLAIVFAPVNRGFCKRFSGKDTPAALLTLAVIIAVVIFPLVVVVSMVSREIAGVYAMVQSGEINIADYLQRIFDALPAWLTRVLDGYGLGSLADIRERLSTEFKRGFQFLATHAVGLGQYAFDFIVGFFVMLYVLFFLLRDGSAVARRIRESVPLAEDLKRKLFANFATVIRATIKGNIVVAILQGALGGFIFWVLGIKGAMLWGVLMAFLSLLPAVGTALVWVPVAIYLLVSGSIWQGVVLIAFGVIVIGLVDNIVRPILVGKDTRMPDYLVLMTTLGGIAVFGINGFVIGPVIAAMFIAVWSTVPGTREGD